MRPRQSDKFSNRQTDRHCLGSNVSPCVPQAVGTGRWINVRIDRHTHTSTSGREGKPVTGVTGTGNRWDSQATTRHSPAGNTDVLFYGTLRFPAVYFILYNNTNPKPSVCSQRAAAYFRLLVSTIKLRGPSVLDRTVVRTRYEIYEIHDASRSTSEVPSING